MSSSPDVLGRPARILIVDDERHNRQVLEVMLSPEGFELLAAASGEEALAMVAAGPPDLILLDIMMPSMNGYEVAARLKGDLATKNIPVIMVTALDDRKARMLGLDAGAEDFLSKPVDRAELRVRVRNFLRLKAYGDYYDKYSQMLEGEVVSRTADFADRTKTLEEADSQLLLLTEREQSRQDQMRFKDEFLSHVSHELRSPLTAIKQFTTILLGGLAGELNTDQREYQQVVLRNINQLQSMIDDLLEVTRLENGKVSIELESASVPEAVTDTLDSFALTAGAKGISLSSDLPSDLPSALADATRLRQILIVLVDNAIKFTPAGGAVSVQVRLLLRDPRFLLIEVTDNGCGIKPEMRDRIFERLYQVPEAAQSSRNGLGLGLYICKELVTRQGGQIWVDCPPENGCVFSFTLPVHSLESVFAPLLNNDRWPADSVALITVESRARDAWPSSDAQEEWSREARSLLQRCLRLGRDVLLPTVNAGPQGARFHVVAFADARGASILADRIGDQFARLVYAKPTSPNIAVSYRVLEPIPSGVGASSENILTRMAAALDASIKSHITPEAAYHE